MDKMKPVFEALNQELSQEKSRTTSTILLTIQKTISRLEVVFFACKKSCR